MTRRPACYGGDPIFDTLLNVVKPFLPPFEHILPKLEEVFQSGILSNNARYVRELEKRVSEYLGVRNCVAMCNGTLTLILTLKALGITGKVIVPSFTFCATVHAVKWAGLEPVFADIDPNTFNITHETIERVLTDDVSAIMPVHVFGMPCDIDGIGRLANARGLKVVYDSAQAIGARYKGRLLGSYGEAESFSAHATKIIPAGEGGLVTTNNDEIATYLRSARNFGVQGDVDCALVGINAKMSEIQAILSIEGLKLLDDAIAHRSRLVQTYHRGLADIPGVTFQSPTPSAESNYQNFAVLINTKQFGMNRDDLFEALKADNIIGRKYFYPPIHKTTAYGKDHSHMELPVTDAVSERVLCLPLYSNMPIEYAERVCSAIRNIRDWTLETDAMTDKRAVSQPSLAPLTLDSIRTLTLDPQADRRESA